MIRFNSAGRVQPIEGMYLTQPGTCLLCGKVPDHGQEYFASLGVELEYYGLAYLCQPCCKEIADFVLYVSPEKLEVLTEMNMNLVAKNLELQKSLNAAKEMLNARIDSAGTDKSGEYGIINPPVFEVESGADSIDSILNPDKSRSSESGKGKRS